MIALVALRLGIGWHFFKEGSRKVQDPEFSSASFLRQAKGPWSDFFKSQIPDVDGRLRLDEQWVTARWDALFDRAASHYQYDDRKRQLAADRLAHLKEQLGWYLADHRDDIDVYFHEVDRLAAAKRDERTTEAGPAGLSESRVPFQQTWIDQQEGKLRSTAAPWLATIADLERQLTVDLHRIAAPEHRGRELLAPPSLSQTPVDTVVTYLTFGVGVLLMLGLFTRLASLGGAAFLTMVIATQPPWIADAAPTYNQAIELLALLVLAAVGAGRFAGLDFLVSMLWRRIRAPRQTGTES